MFAFKVDVEVVSSSPDMYTNAISNIVSFRIEQTIQNMATKPILKYLITIRSISSDALAHLFFTFISGIL